MRQYYGNADVTLMAINTDAIIGKSKKEFVLDTLSKITNSE
jgi:hypothetical protein